MSARTFAALAACLALAPGCRSQTKTQETLLIAGNASLARYLEPVVREFTALHPSASVVVEPGGSTAAVIALKRGAIDVAALSRLVAAEEDDPYLHDYQICRDGIAIVLSPANPLLAGGEASALAEAKAAEGKEKSRTVDLTKRQLEDIFSGDVTSWKQLGGPDRPINAYVREKTSRSSRSFNELVLDGDDPFPGAKVVKRTDDMIEALKKDPNGIGFLSVRKLTKELVVAKVEGVEMNRLTMLSGRYPLARTFYLAVYMKPSKLAEEFLQFTLSKTGQELLAKDGLLAVH